MCRKSDDCPTPTSLLPKPGSLWYVFWFPKIELVLKGRRCDSIDDIKRNSSQALKDISKETFQDRVAKWKHSWDKYVKRGEEYFKGNKDQ